VGPSSIERKLPLSKLVVIAVHGISDSVLHGDYTHNFKNLLYEKLKRLKVIPNNATQEEYDQYVAFDYVNYSDIGHPEELHVLEAYTKERNKLYNFLDQLIERGGFDQVRRQIITSLSDIMVYQSTKWRDQVRQRLLDKINPFVNTGDAVSVVGHSLGSVVSFDTLYYNSRHNDSWKAAGFKPSNLFTVGSPIALFSLELEDDTGVQKPRYFTAAATPNYLDPKNTNPDLDPVRNDGMWYNFMDAQDLIAYPLEVLFEGKFKVKDILVQTGTNPLTAHTEYWNNNEVAQRIAERLALDYKRISGGN